MPDTKHKTTTLRVDPVLQNSTSFSMLRPRKSQALQQDHIDPARCCTVIGPSLQVSAFDGVRGQSKAASKQHRKLKPSMGGRKPSEV